MKKIKILFLVFFISNGAFAQLNISGSSCVMRGVIYEYWIKGLKEKTDMFKICVSGGVLAGSDNSCTGDTILSMVRVIWSDDISVTSGRITIASGITTKTINTTLFSTLEGGIIDSSLSLQRIDTAMLPVAIKCVVAREGMCNAKYTYQWESSPDAIKWVAINGANYSKLEFATGLIQTTYYRRKVMEHGTGSVAYSNTAVVFLNVKNR